MGNKFRFPVVFPKCKEEKKIRQIGILSTYLVNNGRFCLLFRFHFHFSPENDREIAKIFLFSLPNQREIIKIFSFHFPNNGKNLFFSLFTSQVTGKVYFFSFHFPPNGIFFLFSLFSSRNGETISRWTLHQLLYEMRL